MIKKVLDKGSVELYDYTGDDLKIVNSARVSYGKRHNRLEPGDDKIIQYLMKNKHGTPFEQPDFTFVIKCPISVAREWFRHRIASYNEISGRYVKLEPEFYIPEGKAVRSQTGKSGSYTFKGIKDSGDVEDIQYAMGLSYEKSYTTYEWLLSKGVAKEVARNTLPIGIYTQFFFKVNARSLMNFISLRTDKNAMLEIREYAIILEEILAEKLPITYEAFVKFGKVAP